MYRSPSLVSALSSVSNPTIIGAVQQRFNEREEACAQLAKVAAEATARNEERLEAERTHAEVEETLRAQVWICPEDSETHDV